MLPTPAANWLMRYYHLGAPPHKWAVIGVCIIDLSRTDLPRPEKYPYQYISNLTVNIQQQAYVVPS